MAEEKTQQAACDMCKTNASDGLTKKNNCCTNFTVHHHLDEDGTIVHSTLVTPLPLEAELPVLLFSDSEEEASKSSIDYSTFRRSDQPAFLAILEHTVLRV